MPGRIEDESFFVCEVEEGSVVDACVMGEAAAQDGRVPGIEVGIEVDYAYGAEVFERRS